MTAITFNPRIRSTVFDAQPGTPRTLTLNASYPAPFIKSVRASASRAATHTLWTSAEPAPFDTWNYALIEVDPNAEHTDLKTIELLLTPSAGNPTLLLPSSLIVLPLQRTIDDAHGAPANTIDSITIQNPDGDEVDVTAYFFRT